MPEDRRPSPLPAASLRSSQELYLLLLPSLCALELFAERNCDTVIQDTVIQAQGRGRERKERPNRMKSNESLSPYLSAALLCFESFEEFRAHFDRDGETASIELPHSSSRASESHFICPTRPAFFFIGTSCIKGDALSPPPAGAKKDKDLRARAREEEGTKKKSRVTSIPNDGRRTPTLSSVGRQPGLFFCCREPEPDRVRRRDRAPGVPHLLRRAGTARVEAEEAG